MKLVLLCLGLAGISWIHAEEDISNPTEIDRGRNDWGGISDSTEGPAQETGNDMDNRARDSAWGGRD